MGFAATEIEEASLGLAPLVDVMLLLLVFFLVTSSFNERRLPLELPEASYAASARVPKVRVALSDAGDLFLDGKPTSLEELDLRLGNQGGSTDLQIRADLRVRHGRVVEVLDLARKHGVSSIAIAVSGRQPGSALDRRPGALPRGVAEPPNGQGE